MQSGAILAQVALVLGKAEQDECGSGRHTSDGDGGLNTGIGAPLGVLKPCSCRERAVSQATRDGELKGLASWKESSIIRML